MHGTQPGNDSFSFVYSGDCCHVGGGRRIISSTTTNRSACEARCRSEASCAYISVKGANAQGETQQIQCVLCATCILRQHSGHFTSWSREPMPSQVEHLGMLLQEEYSMQLYGAPNMVDIGSLRVVWLSLLPAAALHEIARSGGVCKYESGYPWRPFFTALDIFANPTDALWISWERATLAGFPVRNHSWVEVTHCAQGHGRVGHTRYGWQFGPMWLYAAPGSGVSINVGRSVVMSHSDAARLLRRVYPSALECACEPHCAFGRKLPSKPVEAKNGSSCISHTAMGKSEGGSGGSSLPLRLLRYVRCWTRDDVLAELDTIQIYDHVEYFGRERRHEIVRLRGDGECAKLESDTPHLRCGRPPHLMRCGPNSTSLQRVNRCSSSKAPLNGTLAKALNFTGRRCAMTSVY